MCPRCGSAIDADWTEREVEVVRLLARGHTSKEVAGMLRNRSSGELLAVKTVEAHKHNAYRKMGITNLAQLIALAHIKGIHLVTDTPLPGRSVPGSFGAGGDDG
jgi:DNA-binding NarL/FixJ family response regulator